LFANVTRGPGVLERGCEHAGQLVE
jgi:hypothetical protein